MYCYVLCHKNTHNSDHCCLVWCAGLVCRVCSEGALLWRPLVHGIHWSHLILHHGFVLTRGVQVCNLLYIQSSWCPTGRYWSLAILSVISQVVRSPRCYCRAVFRAIKLIKSHIWRLRRWVILQQWRWRPGVGAGVNLSRGGGNWRQG